MSRREPLPSAPRALRLAGYLGVLVLGGATLSVRAARAEGVRAANTFAGEIEHLDLPPGDGVVLTINGQRIRLASAHLRETVREVLDRAESACRTHADGLGDDLGALGGFATQPPSTRGVPGVGLLRDEREGRGVVLCFATEEALGTAGVVARLIGFARGRDLRAVGALRHLSVHAEGEGSRVTAAWSDDRLSLDAMFPNRADAAGGDPGVALRPARSRRVLTSRIEPTGYAVFGYTSRDRPERALDDYRARMIERGFTVIGLGERSPRSAGYRSGLVDVLVTASDREDGGASLSIVESHHAGTPVLREASR
jgi:hypothetical protein